MFSIPRPLFLGVYCGLILAVSPVASRAVRGAGPQARSGAQGWTVTFHMSGGFAGFMRTLHVSSAGELAAEDARRPDPVNARATPEELAELASFIAKGLPARQVRSGTCRDCLQYGVEIFQNGQRSAFQFDDTTLTGSEVERPVKLLMAMLNRTLTTPPPP
jgi:hypothetical protein